MTVFIVPAVALLRAPLAPITASDPATRPPTEPDASAALRRAAADPVLMEAIAVASPDLSAAIDRCAGGTDNRAARRAAVGVAGYAARARARATPFGLFAGVGVAWFDEQREPLAWWGDAHRTRTRPDQAWLRALVARLHSDPAVVAGLCVTVHPLVRRRGTRLVLERWHRSDAQATPVLQELGLAGQGMAARLLEAAARPVPVTELLAGAADGDRDKALRVVLALLNVGFLQSELDRSRDYVVPLRQVEVVLRRVGASAAAGEVAAVNERIRAYDWCRPGEGLSTYRALTRAMSAAATSTQQVCVDTALDAQVRLPRSVLAEANLVGSLLWRLTAQESHPLAEYHQRFLERYGQDRAVPILDVLDDHRGLGVPAAYLAKDAPSGERSPAAVARDERMFTLWAEAASASEVRLDDQVLTRWLRDAPPPSSSPLSCDLFTRLAARDLAAMTAGEFTLVEPGFSTAPAGASVARFSDLLDPRAIRALRDLVRSDRPADPGAHYAEVHYSPLDPRSGNVARNLGWLPRRICVDRGPAAEGDIGLRDVSLFSDGERLHAQTQDERLVPVTHHLLNTRFAPAAARLLLDIGHGMRPRSWAWGGLLYDHAPFLPRVTYGRSILALASWRLPEALTAPARNDLSNWRAEFNRWRREVDLPDCVEVATGDMRVPLDLDSPDAVDLLRREVQHHELRRVREIPDVSYGWLRGRDGPRLTEIVAPLLPAEASPPAAGPAPAAVVRPVRRAGASEHLPGVGRWLYAILHVPQRSQDAVLLGMAEHLARHEGRWFFVRYIDDGCPSLRLRVATSRDEQGQLLRGIGGQVVQLREAGLVGAMRVDTYDPEIERYGGPGLIDAAEDAWCADSAAVLAGLGSGRDAVVSAALAVFGLLYALAPEEADRRWLAKVGGQPGPRRREVRHLVASATFRDWLGADARLWERRLAAAACYGRLIAGLASERREHAIRSMIHMHCNRVLGTERALEGEVLRLARDAAETCARTGQGTEAALVARALHV